LAYACYTFLFSNIVASPNKIKEMFAFQKVWKPEWS
jgi:hypothetical protein